MPDEAKAEPINGDTVRVRFLAGVEVDGARHDPGSYETDVSSDEAKALVETGRGEILGEPLNLPDQERARLPKIEVATSPATVGQAEAEIDHQA